MSAYTLYCPGRSTHQSNQYLPLLAANIDELALEEKFPDIYFTDKQVECLQWIAKGYSNRVVAEQMQISVRTVDSHLAAIKCKLNCYTKRHLLKKLEVLPFVN